MTKIDISEKYLIDTLRRDNKPIITVELGQTFNIPTINGFGKHIDTIETFQQLIEDKSNKKHLVTGPIYIRNIKRADVVSVQIKRIRLVSNYYQCISYSTGVFPGYSGDRNYHIFENRKSINFSDFLIDVSPSIGFIATTPNKSISCGRAGSFGGNLDLPDIKETTVIHLPVYYEGGFLAIGDVHATQGEGEVSGTGAEVDASVTLQVCRSRYKIYYPVIETENKFLIVGFGRYLKNAIQKAVGNSLNFLSNFSNMAKPDLYLMLGLAGNICLGNSTGYTKVAAIKISKEIWKSIGLF